MLLPRSHHYILHWEEKNHLAKIKALLTEDDLQKIINTTVELKKLHGAKDFLEDWLGIPSLYLTNLKREVTKYPFTISKNEVGSGVTVLRHELGSSLVLSTRS